MSIMPPGPDDKTNPPACTTMGCPAIGSVPGIYDDGSYEARANYCLECASVLVGTFVADDPDFAPLKSDSPAPRVRRYIVGTWCPRGGGHFALMVHADYDGSCGSKGWPLFIEVEDGDDLPALPEGYFEDEG